ncbi:hypothetical protein B0H67DRAFT_585572 [Lasiosphaeris hirsuta]|uniref:Protein ECM13 n=1 Tax=Lasiosphaeris hirsuta TaxID=260670 RepID=A0AA40DS79_9PEZI|nr:hypothetical protein B0H67DRAFT_585572 [Lasiosphaeris hirsuta]
MPSTLQLSTQTQSRPKTALPASPIVSSPFKIASKKMSITQAYFLAHKARAKLSSEAARPDHNLRLLVGHANLLDSLMLELAEAEREQESWFNQSVRGATKSEDKHVQWADSVEEPEHDWHAEDAESDSSDDDSDFSDDEDVEMADVVSLRRIPSHSASLAAPQIQDKDYDYDYDMEDDSDYEDDENFAELALQRSPSHSASPPELDHDEDTSEDESMPPSPPVVVLPAFSEKTREPAISTTTTEFYAPTQDDKDAFYDQGFYLPPRNPARIVSAISVY